MDERRDRTSFVISCDDCAMQCSPACEDCVVTFLVRDAAPAPEAAGDGLEPLTLDADEARVVELLAKAGLVPELRYRVAV